MEMRKYKMGSATYVGGSHLKFRKCPLKKGKKMPRYKIINKTLRQEIGIIHWRGGWYQYVSQTKPEVDMSRSCNAEVNKFIDKLMKEWRDKRKKKASQEEE